MDQIAAAVCTVPGITAQYYQAPKKVAGVGPGADVGGVGIPELRRSPLRAPRRDVGLLAGNLI